VKPSSFIEYFKQKVLQYLTSLKVY